MSIANLTDKINLRTSGVIYESYGERGHLKMNYLKLKNNKGERIRVEVDVTTIANSNSDSVDYFGYS